METSDTAMSNERREITVAATLQGYQRVNWGVGVLVDVQRGSRTCTVLLAWVVVVVVGDLDMIHVYGVSAERRRSAKRATGWDGEKIPPSPNTVSSTQHTLP
jgi:hypothetical protein